jgi:hypothetical protein
MVPQMARTHHVHPCRGRFRSKIRLKGTC